jgi:hypothetical protein
MCFPSKEGEGCEGDFTTILRVRVRTAAMTGFDPATDLVRWLYSLSRREESCKHKLSDCLLDCVSAGSKKHRVFYKT